MDLDLFQCLALLFVVRALWLAATPSQALPRPEPGGTAPPCHGAAPPPPPGESTRMVGAGESGEVAEWLEGETPGPGAAGAVARAALTGAPAVIRPDPPPAAGAAGTSAAEERSARRRTRRGNRPGRVRSPNGWRSRDVRSGLLIGAINIQSMKPKILEINHELSKRRYDLLSVTETWLKPSTPNRLLSFPGYRLFRADRPDKSGYGGVAVLHAEKAWTLLLSRSRQQLPILVR